MARYVKVQTRIDNHVSSTAWVPESELETGGGISGLTAGHQVRAASATTIETDGVKRYVALLTQTGTSDPVATVLENSLGGTVGWTRTGVGDYTGTLAGAFVSNRTVLILGSFIPQIDTPAAAFSNGYLARVGSDAVNLITTNFDTGFVGGKADDLLSDTSVIIYVYP